MKIKKSNSDELEYEMIRLVLIWLAVQIPACVIIGFAVLAHWRGLIFVGVVLSFMGIFYVIMREREATLGREPEAEESTGTST